jgi:hypothetical protein
MTISASPSRRISSAPRAFIVPVVRELPSVATAALTTQTW